MTSNHSPYGGRAHAFAKEKGLSAPNGQAPKDNHVETDCSTAHVVQKPGSQDPLVQWHALGKNAVKAQHYRRRNRGGE